MNTNSTSKNINYIDFNSTNGDLKMLSTLISDALEKVGYIIVKNFNTDIENLDDAKQKFLNIAKSVGNPIPHAGEDSIIWDIKSNDQSVSFIKTYSEHSHEADLHTDSQYSSYPEDFFGLLTLKKADCGGGISYLIKLDEILEELRQTTGGLDAEKILRETNFPFIVPNVFKKEKNQEHEYNFGPILRDNEIRFRVDTFEKAISSDPDLCTETQITAYQKIKTVILNSTKTRKFHLEAKDLIFINNKITLHGRSEFTDNTRHLLRIRMNKFIKTEY